MTKTSAPVTAVAQTAIAPSHRTATMGTNVPSTSVTLLKMEPSTAPLTRYALMTATNARLRAVIQIPVNVCLQTMSSARSAPPARTETRPAEISVRSEPVMWKPVPATTDPNATRSTVASFHATEPSVTANTSRWSVRNSPSPQAVVSTTAMPRPIPVLTTRMIATTETPVRVTSAPKPRAVYTPLLKAVVNPALKMRIAIPVTPAWKAQYARLAPAW